jgi:hypothetical protein
MNFPELTSSFARIIIETPLFQTGELYRSVQCTVEYQGDILVFHIFCKDYVKYHLKEERLIERWSETPEFQGVLSVILERRMESIIGQGVATGQPPNYDRLIPQMEFLVN